MTTQDQIAEAYDNPSLPWISINGGTTRIYVVRTPLGHLESEDPREAGGYPVRFHDDTWRSGVLLGEFPELGSVHYSGDQQPQTAVWTDGTHGEWVSCDPFGNPTGANL